jgi:membrane associated rhomboid family serine protease
MGIYDRDYYRREGPSFLGSLASRAPVTKWIIVLNVALFVIQIATLNRSPLDNRIIGDGPVTTALHLDPEQVIHQGYVWQLLTHAFLHSTENIWHIVFNMLVLWWVGTEVEELYGSREFLALYLISAVFAGICFVLFALSMPGRFVAVGASGAITALTVIFAYHYPHRTVLLFFVIPMPIWLLVVLYVGWDFLVFVFRMETQTAVAAHLGGALFGFLYYKNKWRLTRFLPGLRAWKRERARPKLKIFREEQPATVPAHAPAEHEIDEHFEAKLDAVLEKMSLVGKDNLTDHEKEILLRASEIYKRRRT